MDGLEYMVVHNLMAILCTVFKEMPPNHVLWLAIFPSPVSSTSTVALVAFPRKVE